MAAITKDNSPAIVPVALTGGRVTAGFRQALFDAADRAGITINEFVLKAAGEKLAKAGASFPGVFRNERGATRVYMTDAAE